jgi:TetR/AcrR family transcriptional regulator, tetracycline repressor protein
MVDPQPLDPQPLDPQTLEPDRHPLDRMQVINAAMAIIDQRGILGLTMRRLGSAVGVEAGSLYHWFANKQAVLDGVVESVRAEAFAAAFDETKRWQEGLYEMAVRYYNVLLSHPGVLPMMGNAILTSGGLHQVEALIGYLVAQGFDAVAAYALLTSLVGYVMGAAMRVSSVAIQGPNLSQAERIALGRHLDEHKFPHLRMLAERAVPADIDSLFHDGLRAWIAGIEVLRERGSVHIRINPTSAV